MKIAGKRKLEIVRDGSSVSLVIHCRDAYEAIQLYDKANDEMKSGGISLKMAGPIKERQE